MTQAVSEAVIRNIGTEVFQMNQWRQTTLESLYAEPSRNGLTRPKSIRGNGFPMINMGEIFAHERIGDIEMELVPMSEREIESFTVRRGDLLFARQSLVAAGAGKCALVKSVAETTTFESHLIRVRLDQKQAEPDFFFYYFLSPQGKANVQSLVMQVAAAGIRGSELAKLQVTVPPLPEQRRIAGILSAYDDLIENSQRRIKILETMAQSLYREWFINFRFPGHENVSLVNSTLGEIPQGWEVRRIGEVADTFRGRSYRSVDLAEEGGLPFLNLKCLDRDGGFRRSGLKRYTGEYKPGHVAKKGDIVMGLTDMTQERRIVARAALVPTLDNEFGIASMDLVRIEPKQPMPKTFLYSFLRYSSFADEVKQHANGANVLHLSPERITDFRFPVPPADLMRQFSTFVAPTLEQVDTLHNKVENLCRTRDLLLPRLLSGQVSLKEK